MKYKNEIARIRRCCIYLIILILFFINLFSCKKILQVSPPINQILDEEVFANDATAISAISGLYSQVMATNLCLASGGATLLPGLSADELLTAQSNTSYYQFNANELDPSNKILEANLWANGYKIIYQSNAIIAGLKASTGISESVKNQLVGESEFVRAFCYFYMTNLFGAVPLITSTDYQVNQNSSRADTGKIYQQIIVDLKDASGLLSSAYPTDDKGRPNKGTAVALLSRVYLFQRDWKDAESFADELINAGQYFLEDDLNKVFLNNSVEAIWQLIPVTPGYNTWDGVNFIPKAGLIPNYQLSNSLLNAFETGDNRKKDWIGYDTLP